MGGPILLKFVCYSDLIIIFFSKLLDNCDKQPRPKDRVKSKTSYGTFSRKKLLNSFVTSSLVCADMMESLAQIQNQVVWVLRLFILLPNCFGYSGCFDFSHFRIILSTSTKIKTNKTWGNFDCYCAASIEHFGRETVVSSRECSAPPVGIYLHWITSLILLTAFCCFHSMHYILSR